MDKKNVMGSLSATRKRKPNKKLVDAIRKETFQSAYPNQAAAEAAQQEQSTGDESTPKKQEAEEDGQRNTIAQENTKQTESTGNPSTEKSKRGRKKKELPDGPNEFTTLNCTQVTLNRAKISSALTKTPMYQFVDEAIDHYIQYLKKNGKLNLDL